jgi:hypothetical protein
VAVLPACAFGSEAGGWEAGIPSADDGILGPGSRPLAEIGANSEIKKTYIKHKLSENERNDEGKRRIEDLRVKPTLRTRYEKGDPQQ